MYVSIYLSICNILTWPAGVNTADVVDRFIDKIWVITWISSYPLVLCTGGCWDSCIRPRIKSTRWLPECHHAHMCCVSADVETATPRLKIISTKWLPEYHLDLWMWLNSVMVADTSAHKSGLGQVANGNKQHNQWKAKKWDVGVTIVNEKVELRLVT